MSANIKHVSDTALWVATFRANETQRPDGLFRDPLAGKLTAGLGHRIASEMPHSKMVEWYTVMRTLSIDRLVALAIELGAETVVNLGAGLDTRPYRMDLPSDLNWIEVDFPQLIDYKIECLRSDKPRCNLERVGLDLSDDVQRRHFLKNLAKRSQKVLVITEGVLLYLESEQVANLSRDLLETATIKYWIQDYRNVSPNDFAQKRIRNALKNSPFRFTPEKWVDFFVAHGWETKELILAVEMALRVWRPFPYTFPWNILSAMTPSAVKREMSHANGCVLFSRSKARSFK